MYPLPPVELAEPEGNNSVAIEIPVLEDPEPVIPGKARDAKRFGSLSISRRHGVLLGIGLFAIAATWAVMNIPLHDVLPDNWQAQLKALNGSEGVAGNDS